MGTKAHFDPASDPECYEPRMTRAEALARRTAGTLRENCVVVITDGPVIGNGVTSPTEIELNPTSPTALGLTARVKTDWDDSSWAGIYDIDLGTAGTITRLEDNSGNVAMDQDADAPTVHTQFPWHLGAFATPVVGNWRDNYAEDTTFTSVTDSALPHAVTNNRFINTAVDFTGWTLGTMVDNLIQGTGIHHIANSSFWQRSNIVNGTVNATSTGGLTLTQSDILASTITNNTAQGMTISSSTIEDASTLTHNSTTGVFNVTNSNLRQTAQVITDPGSMKSVSVGSSVIEGLAVVRGVGGTVARSINISGTKLRGKPTAGDTIQVIGDAGITIGNSDVSNSFATWVIDGNDATILQWNRMNVYEGTITTGPLSQNNQWSNSTLDNCIVNVTGPGDGNFSTAISGSKIANTTIRMTGTGENITIQQAFLNGNSGATIAIDGGSPRGLLIDGGSQFSGPFSVIQTGTVAGGGTNNDRVFNTIINGGTIEFATTAGGGAFNNAISRCAIYNGPAAPGVPDGIIRIDGTSNDVFVDSCEVWGEVTITDAPSGALNGATRFYDNYVASGSFIRYIGGDNVAKQIRHNRVEGQSSMTLTGLTGSAGAALGDVFACRVANQSVLNVTGARVVGFPVRNCTVENGSTLTIPASGSALQIALQNNADLDTGAFVQFDSEISGAFAKVATASNINALCNKSYDDWV